MADQVTNPAIKRVLEIARSHAAAHVLQLPSWEEPKRGTPNSLIRSALFAAIQSKDRVFLKETTVGSPQGITVKFTGEQLNQEDLSVWATLVHLAREQPLGRVSEFSAHSVLKSLGLHTGLSQHRQLHSTIVRLTACAVEIKHQDKTYFGALVKSGVKDQVTGHYRVELNRDLIRLFGDDQWTKLDWHQRQRLRGKHLAQALHAMYSSHRTPYPLKVETLRAYVGSRNLQKAGFKASLRSAFQELIAIGFLSAYAIKGDVVRVERAMPALSP